MNKVAKIPRKTFFPNYAAEDLEKGQAIYISPKGVKKSYIKFYPSNKLKNLIYEI